MVTPVPQNLTVSLSIVFPRKGGEGGGGRGSGGGKGSSSGAAGSTGESFGVPSSSGKGTSSASSSSLGGGTPTIIAGGSPFAGRLSGGATRVGLLLLILAITDSLTSTPRKS